MWRNLFPHLFLHHWFSGFWFIYVFICDACLPHETFIAISWRTYVWLAFPKRGKKKKPNKNRWALLGASDPFCHFAWTWKMHAKFTLQSRRLLREPLARRAPSGHLVNHLADAKRKPLLPATWKKWHCGHKIPRNWHNARTKFDYAFYVSCGAATGPPHMRHKMQTSG